MTRKTYFDPFEIHKLFVQNCVALFLLNLAFRRAESFQIETVDRAGSVSPDQILFVGESTLR